VKAGHKNIGGTGQSSDHFRPYLNNLAKAGAQRQIFVGFTLYFTGMASDTLFSILKKVEFAHFPFILLLG
jgi:hypothetical protein